MDIRFGYKPHQRQRAHRELKAIGYKYTMSFIHDEKLSFQDTFMYCKTCNEWKCKDKDTYIEFCCPSGCEGKMDICSICGRSSWSYDIDDKVYRHPNAVIGSDDWRTIQIVTRKTIYDFVNAINRANKRQKTYNKRLLSC